jgi:hypothetical protein
MYAGLDIGGKRTAICVINGSGKTVWGGTVDTHPEMIDGALQRFKGSLDKVRRLEPAPPELYFAGRQIRPARFQPGCSASNAASLPRRDIEQ